MLVLGIETSCDDTAVALYDEQAGVLIHELSSQAALHNLYGGVVPELASRDHVKHLLPLIEKSLRQKGLTVGTIDGIAYTSGPGLVGALMVGACLAKTLAYALGKPAIGLHHMESHLLVVGLLQQPPQFPYLALLVSGGHTLLVHVYDRGVYKIIGRTLDDAVGEAFDKVAKVLGLPYPGGPAVAALAKQGGGKRFHFPRPMANQANCNFSFSGLKTHVVHTVQRWGNDPSTLADIAAAFEEAAVDTLINKCILALSQTKLCSLVLVGGVAANAKLRERLSEIALPLGVSLYYPPSSWCTDNAIMVAYNGYLHLAAGKQDPDNAIVTKPRWSMESLEHF